MANIAITALPTVSAPRPNDYLIIQGSKTQKITWQNLVNKMYPVGTIYQSTSSTSPASFLGGTWERIKDCFLLAAGDTYTAGGTGGEATHKLTVAEMPSHNHEGINIDNVYYFGWENGSSTGVNFYKFFNGTYWSKDVQNRLASGYTGGATAHNNMPPYLTVYVWKRTA